MRPKEAIDLIKRAAREHAANAGEGDREAQDYIHILQMALEHIQPAEIFNILAQMGEEIPEFQCELFKLNAQSPSEISF